MAAGGEGYYHANYVHDNYWHVDYWAEAGAAPPAVEGVKTPMYLIYPKHPDGADKFMVRCAAAALGLLLLLVPAVAPGHPGRLNAEGCHEVHTRYVYKSGTVVEPGDSHCHRKLGQGFKLDGREVLQESEEAPPAAPVKDEEIQP